MRANVINQFGAASIFALQEIPKPELKPGHLLIRVMATSVNPVDFKIRSGAMSQIAPNFPAVLHSDVAGVVEAIAPDVKDFRIGEEVFGCAGGVKGEGGALAEYMLADAKLIARKPTSLSMPEAAALPLVSITAWEALFDKLKISTGDKVLIHGGAGGVGHIAIQLAKWAGATVFTTVSNSQKDQIVKALGADVAINYREERVSDYVKRLTQGKGFNLIVDTIGGKALEDSIQAAACYANIVTIQANSTHDLSPLFFKSASLHTVMMLVPLLTHLGRERHGAILKHISELADKGILKPVIHNQSFALNEAGKAHALLESGKAIGKIVINI